MKKILLRTLSSAILASILTAIILPVEFFFILYGIGFSIFILTGSLLCGLVQFICVKYFNRCRTNNIYSLFLYLFLGNIYTLLLGGFEWKSIVVGINIGIMYFLANIFNREDAVSNKKLLRSVIIAALVILVTIVYFKQPSEQKEKEKARLEILSIFNAQTQLFRSVVNFVQAQEAERFAVYKPNKATNRLEAITFEPHKVLELDKGSAVYKNMEDILYKYKFIKIHKIEGLIYFI